MSDIYCLDTSALVNPWRKMWPPDLAPLYWEGVAALALEGRIILTEEVREELLHKDDELASWAAHSAEFARPFRSEFAAPFQGFGPPLGGRSSGRREASAHPLNLASFPCVFA